jgi:hypothetical protein
MVEIRVMQTTSRQYSLYLVLEVNNTNTDQSIPAIHFDHTTLLCSILIPFNLTERSREDTAFLRKKPLQIQFNLLYASWILDLASRETSHARVFAISIITNAV